jgi:4'-phosphopantetheinyl transferase
VTTFQSPSLARVVVWTVRQHASEAQQRMSAYVSLLSEDERRRAERFHHHADRDRFVIGRALARTMLARYGGRPAREWPILVDSHGRPELDSQADGIPDLRFNLSHTDGLIACAITSGREVGVDVEHIGRRLTHDVAERFFSRREVAALRSLPPDEQGIVFFDYWTLKESYIKARGLGLALPLAQFTFVRSAGGAPRVEFAPELHDEPSSWQFAQFWPTPDHRMAVAVRRHGPDLPIEVRETVPEVEE